MTFGRSWAGRMAWNAVAPALSDGAKSDGAGDAGDGAAVLVL